jgi:WXG100 family type VII secretion target
MAELTVDPVAMQQASKECDGIAVEIRNNINKIQEALDLPANWQGAARRAVLEQFAQQRPLLDQLENLLLKGSTTMNKAAFGFTDHDQAAASGVAGAAAHAGGHGAAPTALTGPALNI